MELLALFFNSLIVGFSGAMMPGPLFVVDVAETPRHGWRTGLVLSTGHAIAEVFVVLALLLGAATIARDPAVANAIGVAGGVALVLMGVMMARDLLSGKVSFTIDGGKTSSSGWLTGKGIMATFSNPYWFVWWATVGFGFLVQSQKHGALGPVVFYFGHILSDYTWYTIVSVLVWRGRRLLVGRGLKIVLFLCAAFLVYLGGTFVYSALASR